MTILDYDGASARLLQALTNSGLSANSKALTEAIIDYFDDNDFRLAHCILNDASTRDWHVMEAGEAGWHLPCLSDDGVATGQSLAKCLSALVSDIDNTRVYPDQVIANGKSIEFRLGGKLMASVQRMTFESVDDKNRQRCAKALKGIRRYGDLDRLAERLRDMPGMSGLQGDKDYRKDYRQQHMMIVDVQNFPAQLRNMVIHLLDVDLGQSISADLVAVMFGAKNWQPLKAAAKSWQDTLGPVLIETTNDLGNVSGRTYYRDNASALWGYCEQIHGIPDAVIEGGRSSMHNLALSLTASRDGRSIVNMRDMQECTDYVVKEIAVTKWHELAAEEIAMVLGELLGVGKAKVLERVAISNLRTQSRSRAIRDKLFTITPMYEKDYLGFQVLVGQDRYAASGAMFPLYKAEIRGVDGKFAIYGDYGRDHMCDLQEFSQEEVLDLCRFTGLRPPRGLALEA